MFEAVWEMPPRIGAPASPVTGTTARNSMIYRVLLANLFILGREVLHQRRAIGNEIAAPLAR